MFASCYKLFSEGREDINHESRSGSSITMAWCIKSSSKFLPRDRTLYRASYWFKADRIDWYVFREIWKVTLLFEHTSYNTNISLNHSLNCYIEGLIKISKYLWIVCCSETVIFVSLTAVLRLLSIFIYRSQILEREIPNRSPITFHDQIWVANNKLYSHLIFSTKPKAT